MADINLMPPYSRPTRSFTGTTTVATAKYGMIAVDGATGNHGDVKISTGAGETKIRGVVGDVGDPNNSNLFATGDNVTVHEEGNVEVLFVATTVIAMDDVIIASATAGQAKVLAGESKPYTVLGYARQGITIGAAAGLASVRLHIHTVPA